MRCLRAGISLAGLIVLLALWVSVNAELVQGACATAGCDDKCKLHNRWCGRFNNMDKGWRYPSTIAPTGYCSQAPDGGTPIELDLISWDQYPNCAKDCANDNLCTGSPGGDKETSGSRNFNTKCKAS